MKRVDRFTAALLHRGSSRRSSEGQAIGGNETPSPTVTPPAPDGASAIHTEPSWDEVRAQFALEQSVSPEVHADDLIWKFVVEHPELPKREDAARYYFSDGAESARKLARIMGEYLPPAPDGERHSLLEFASGYGMVTRHLLRAPKALDVVCCDIHEQAIDFLENKLGATAILSKSVPEDVVFAQMFDAVFALSFFSHMPETTFTRWLSTLLTAVRPGGILVFTTHGVSAAKGFSYPEVPASGFHFAPFSEQHDLDVSEYGSALALPHFVVGELAKLPGAVLLEVRCPYWWGLQDLYVVRRAES